MTDRSFVSRRLRGLNAALARGRQAELFVDLAADGISTQEKVRLDLVSPANLRSLGTSAVARRWPKPGSAKTPAGAMAYVEFHDDDLPWRLSDQGAGRIAPWLTLLVVPETGGGVAFLAGADPNPRLTLTAEASAILPDPLENWALAHVEELPGGGARSRLLSARRLAAGQGWRAVLVPATEAGRLAALGRDVPADTTGPAIRPGEALELPVLDSWTFRTGTAPAFEDIVKDLEPAGPLGAVPIFGWSAATQGAIGTSDRVSLSWLRTALKGDDRFSAYSDPPSFTAPRPVHVVGNALRGVIDVPDVITPPRYGAHHDAAGDWNDDINLDPSLRAAAGFGAEIVRRRQEGLVRAAWDFSGQIDAANYLAGAGFFGSEAARKFHAALTAIPDQAVIALTAPCHARTWFMRGTTSVAAGLADSAEGGAATTWARRATRRAARRRVGARRNGPVDPAGLAARNGQDFIPEGTPTITSGQPARGPFRVVETVDDALELLRLRLDVAPNDPRLRESSDEIEPALDEGRQVPAPGRADRHPRAVDIAAIADALRRETEPRRATGARIAARISGGDPSAPLRQMRIEPEIDLPLVEALSEIAPGLVSPALATMKPNTMTLLGLDRPFCEALMLGANHELMRELMWRNYPGRLDMTPLRRLFPQPDLAGPQNPRREAHTLPIADWTGKAGTHLTETVGSVLLMRSPILELFPDLAMFVYPAVWVAGGGRALAPSDRHSAVHPAVRGNLEPDALYLGYRQSPVELAGVAERPADIPDGSTVRAGYWLVFHGPPGQETFGFDAPGGDLSATSITDLPGWDDLSWDHVGWSEATPNFSPAGAGTGTPVLDEGLNLEGDSASLGAIMTTRPLTLALHLSDLIG